VSAKITESTAAEIADLLKARGASAWHSVDWEFQDGAEFVLFTVELTEKPLERNAPERWYAYDLCEERIPPKSDGSYSWMVVFTHNGDVCDSLMNGVA
jgi:hypothetical protein